MKSTRIAAVAAVASLAGGLVATAAGAAFTDVTSENGYAEHITNVQEAGIATGFDDGSFRPGESLNRGQAAAWIDRSASRVDFDQFTEGVELDVQNPTATVASIEMTSPAAEGGGGWVTLQGGVGGRIVGGEDCTCRLLVLLKDSSDTVVGVSALSVAPGGAVTTAPVMAVEPLAAGETETYRVELQLLDTQAVVAVGGALSAVYSPIADGDPESLRESAGNGPVSLVP